VPIRGFESVAGRADHFQRHVIRQREFVCANEEEYEAAAMAFMNKPVDGVTIKEHLRARDNTTVRVDVTTNEFCYVHDATYIGSYYIARTADIEAYFQRRCR
jgi:hypothetical protein